MVCAADDEERDIALVFRGMASVLTQIKQGRVLSRANQDRLADAASLINEVLEQLAEDDDEGKAAPVIAGVEMNENTLKAIAEVARRKVKDCFRNMPGAA